MGLLTAGGHHPLAAIASPVASAAALLLVGGGLSKLRHPGGAAEAVSKLGISVRVVWIRLLAVAEMTAGVLVLVSPSLLVASAAGGLYAVFAVYLSVRLLRGITGGCGCGGIADVPPSWLHVGLNLVAAGALVTVGITAGVGVDDAVRGLPLLGLAYLVGVPAIAYTAFHMVVLLPPLIAAPTKGVDAEWLDRALRT